MIEIFVHIHNLDNLLSGKIVNAKINYANQYDVRMLINPKKYIIVKSDSGSNVISLRKKRLLDYIKFKKKAN